MVACLVCPSCHLWLWAELSLPEAVQDLRFRLEYIASALDATAPAARPDQAAEVLRFLRPEHADRGAISGGKPPGGTPPPAQAPASRVWRSRGTCALTACGGDPTPAQRLAGGRSRPAEGKAVQQLHTTWAAVAGASRPAREPKPRRLPPLHPPGWWQCASVRQPGRRPKVPIGAPAPRRAWRPVQRTPPAPAAPPLTLANGFDALRGDNDHFDEEHLVPEPGDDTHGDKGKVPGGGVLPAGTFPATRGTAASADPEDSVLHDLVSGDCKWPDDTHYSPREEAEPADPDDDTCDAQQPAKNGTEQAEHGAAPASTPPREAGAGAHPRVRDHRAHRGPPGGSSGTARCGRAVGPGTGGCTAGQPTREPPQPSAKKQSKVSEDEASVLTEFQALADAERDEIMGKAKCLAHLHARITGRAHQFPRWDGAGFTCPQCCEADCSVRYPRGDGSSRCEVCTRIDVEVRLRQAPGQAAHV